MCLAVPGKIISIDKSDSEAITAKVSFGGAMKDINIQWLPDAKEGDYIMAHVGTGLEIISQEEAELAIQTSNDFAEMQKIEDKKFSEKAD